MASVSRARDRAQLEEDLKSDEYQHLLCRLQRDDLFLRQFGTWADVVAFMRGGSSVDSRKDAVLRPIFEAHAQDEDPHWRTILLVVFWIGLEAIHSQRSGWDTDERELWQNLVWTFLQVICRIDVKRRPDRLVQKVFNDTLHRFCEAYRRTWNRASRERATDPEVIKDLAGGVEGIDLAGIDRRAAQEAAIRRLRDHLEAGRISEADFLLLVGTRVYGQTVGAYAREAGLNREVAKKRRQRAEAVIERFERGARGMPEATCPHFRASTPLLLGEDLNS